MAAIDQENAWGVHPLLIVLPLVLLTTSVSFDLLAMVLGDSVWNDLGGANLASGLAAALVTLGALARRHTRLVPGTDVRKQSLLVLKLSMGSALLVAVALGLRMSHGAGSTPREAVLLSIGALGVATLAGWLSEGQMSKPT